MKRYYIGVEIGGTNLRSGLIDANFHAEQFRKIPTSLFAREKDKIGFLARLAEEYIAVCGRENVAAVTMALASLMDKERTVVYSSPMIPGFEGISLVDGLSRKLGIPVIIEKDVNILLRYEIWRNHLPTEGIIAGTFLGTGLGNAMCIDGRVYAGHSGTACELGHIPVPDLEEMCGCGKKGCVELLTCGRLLYKLATEKYGCRVDDIFELYGQEQPVRDIVRYCAVAIAAEITILDPAYMILGGGVMEMKGFPMDDLQQTVRENLRIPNPRDSIRFVPASGDSEAGVIGAALHAADRN